MSKEQNVATQGLGGEIAATRQFDRFGEVFADGVVDHDAAEDQASGVEGIKQYWRGVSESFPDFKLDVDVFLADEDWSWARLTDRYAKSIMQHPVG